MKKMPHFETVVGSTAWQMEQEAMTKGMEKGIEKGRQEEKHAFAMRLLSEGFPTSKVAEWVGMSIFQVEKLQSG